MSQSITGKDWLVAVSEPQRHEVALRNLETSGFTAYLPRIVKSVIVRGRHVKTPQPLFGRYFFVLLSDAWRSVRHVRGVSNLLLMPSEESLDCRPCVIKALEVERLRGQELVDAIDPRTRFIIGQKVMPRTGPFKGFVGTYGGLSMREREIAFFELFGRSSSVEFKDSNDLVAV